MPDQGSAAARTPEEAYNHLQFREPSRQSNASLTRRNNRAHSRLARGVTPMLPSATGKVSAVGLAVGLTAQAITHNMNKGVSNDFGDASRQLFEEGKDCIRCCWETSWVIS